MSGCYDCTQATIGYCWRHAPGVTWSPDYHSGCALCAGVQGRCGLCLETRSANEIDWLPWLQWHRSAQAGAYFLGWLGLVLGPVAATERAALIFRSMVMLHLPNADRAVRLVETDVDDY